MQGVFQASCAGQTDTHHEAGRRPGACLLYQECHTGFQTGGRALCLLGGVAGQGGQALQELPPAMAPFCARTCCQQASTSTRGSWQAGLDLTAVPAPECECIWSAGGVAMGQDAAAQDSCQAQCQELPVGAALGWRCAGMHSGCRLSSEEGLPQQGSSSGGGSEHRYQLVHVWGGFQQTGWTA
jgi:hypothetical protein